MRDGDRADVVLENLRSAAPGAMSLNRFVSIAVLLNQCDLLHGTITSLPDASRQKLVDIAGLLKAKLVTL